MSIHEKLAASIKDLTAAHAAEIMGVGDECCGPNPCIDCIIGAIKCGLFSDILGVREPTPEDVQREAERVFGAPVGVSISWDTEITFSKYVYDVGWRKRMVTPYMPTNRPASFAAAYAALRALPDYEGEK